MKEINISKNIAELRKQKGVTQEQLAEALNVSPQAVSKWETNTSQPDTQMLPAIADYFEVSIDYLFYGKEIIYSEIYEKIFEKIKSFSNQMSKEAYEDVLKIFGHAHHGITHGNLKNRDTAIYDEPSHISNENGLSLLSGKGFGAVVTKDFFENINLHTVDLAEKLLPAFAERNNILVALAIISMSDISFGELQEKLSLDENTLRASLDSLIAIGIVIEKSSKHKALGFTYEIHSMYHTCLCLLFAILEMQRYSLNGISCCMGYGDYPIKL